MKAASLPPAIDADRHQISGPCGNLSYYHGEPSSDPAGGGARQPALVFIHSINAAPSAYEVRPLFEHFRHSHHVYALELPGFAGADRPDVAYSPRLMTDAIQAFMEHAAEQDGHREFDLVAVSLGCEFVVRAAMESPACVRSVGLISPTGFNGKRPRSGPDGSDLGSNVAYRIVSFGLWADGLFRLLTSRPSIRYFLKKTFGGGEVEPALVDYAWLTSHQPGARYAPFRFLCGFLFSGDIFKVYEAITQPVWVVHGTRGDFVDYRLLEQFAGRPNWTVEVIEGGALPQFEQPRRLFDSLRSFLARLETA